MNKVSAAIRIKNEEKWIEKTIQSIERQEAEESIECVILDSGSTDNSLKIVSKYTKKIHQIQASDFQFGRSCNQIIERCDSEYILLLSGHVWFKDAGVLSKPIKFLDNNNDAAVVYFRQMVDGIVDVDYTRYEKLFLERRFNKKSRWLDIKKTKLPISNAAALVRKSVWESVKFPEVVASEDILWARLIADNGFKIYYDAGVEVIHNHNELPEQIQKRVHLNKIAQYGGERKIKLAVLSFFKVFLGLYFFTESEFSEAYRYSVAHAKGYLK